MDNELTLNEIRAAVAGDPEQLTRLFAHLRIWFRNRPGLVTDETVLIDGEDGVVNEAFATLLKRWRDQPPFVVRSRNEFFAYCRHVIDTTRQDRGIFYGRQKRTPDRPVESASPGSHSNVASKMVYEKQSTPSHRFLRKESADRLNDAVNQLPDQQRDAVRMLLDCKPQIEIARKLKVPAYRVTRLIQNAQGELRRLLRPEG